MSDPDGSQSHYERSISAANGCLNRLFNSCEEDPKGSVHRAWGVSLIFIVLYFILSIVESTYPLHATQESVSRQDLLPNFQWSTCALKGDPVLW